MQDASRQDKKVKHGMYIFLFLTKTVKNRTNRIGDPARQKKYSSPCSQTADSGPDKEDNTPSHGNITDHGEDLVLF